MKMAAMDGSKRVAISEQQAVSRYALSSLSNGSSSAHPLRVSDARRGAIDFPQEADGVRHPLTACAVCHTRPHTPPQVDTSVCRNNKKSSKAGRKRRRRRLLPHLFQPSWYVSSRRDHTSSQRCSTEIADVPMYSRPVSRPRDADGRRRLRDVRSLETSSGPVFEGDQKKDGGRSGAEKQKSGPPEKGNDKGLQRVKRPKKRIGIPPPPKKRD